MDGRTYLEKLIVDRLQAGRGQPEAGRRLGFNLVEIQGAAAGLVAAGALSRNESEQILSDLNQTLRQSGRLEHHQLNVGSVEPNPGPLVGSPVGVARPAWQTAIADPPLPTLRRVLPLAGSTLAVQGDAATLISLDVWTTMIQLNIAVPAAPDIIRQRFLTQNDQKWRGWDDLGTTYRSNGSGGSGSHGLFLEHIFFEPGPSEDAETITLESAYHGTSNHISVALRALGQP